MKLKTKIMAGVLLTLVISIGLMYFVSVYITTKALRDKIHDNISNLTQSYAKQLEIQLNNYLLASKKLAANIITGINVYDVLSEEAKHYPEFKEIYYTDLKGNILGYYPFEIQNFNTQNFSDKKCWQKTHLQCEITLSDPYIYSNEPVIMISAPVMLSYINNKRPDYIGIVSIIISLEKMFNRFQESKSKNNGQIFIFDKNANILSGVSSDLILKTKLSDIYKNKFCLQIEKALMELYQGQGNYFANQKQYTLFFSPIHITGWTIGINIAEDDIVKDIRSLPIIILSITIVAIFISMFLSHIIINTIVKPIYILTNTINLVKNGNLNARAPIIVKDELGLLAKEFNSMTARLQEMVEKLEKEVEEREKAEKLTQISEKRYRGIFENSKNGVFQADKNGDLIIVNPAFAKILGYDSPDEIINNKSDLFQNSLKTNMLNQLKQNKSIENFETKLFKKNNDEIDISLNIQEVIDKNIDRAYYEGIIEDITQTKNIAKLKIAKEVAENSAKTKMNFLANMSHELRTPMNAIIGFLYLILKTKLTDKQYDYLTKIKSSASSLLSIINNILDISKIEAGKFHLNLHTFELEKDILNILSDMFENKISEKEIKFNISIDDNIPKYLVGDYVKLRQILINLVNNAIKFTDQKGKIYIKVNNIGQDKDCVQLKFLVSDSGKGIDSKHIDSLFLPFTQVDESSTRQHEGTGLGLSISKNFIKLMEGKIWVESEIGKGSNFYFTINCTIAQNIKTKKKITQGEDRMSNKNKILLVEDNSINRQVAVEIFTSYGFIVETAKNGLEAINFIKTDNFDAILMDLQMPEMDGYEATRQIRQDPLYKDLPIIAITAHAFKEDKDQCLNIGMNDYITKPIDPDYAISIILKWIQKQDNSAHIEEVITQDIPLIDGIDTQVLLKRIKHNNTLFRNLLKEFVYEHYNIHDQITKAIEDNSIEIAEKKIHTIKGIAANLSAMDIYQASVNLEKEFKKDFKNIDLFLYEFKQAVDKTIKAIKKWDSNNQEDDQNYNVTPTEDITYIIKEFEQLLIQHDLRAEQQLIYIKKHLYPKYQKDIDSLQNYLRKYDFQNAKNIFSIVFKKMIS